MSKSKTQVYKNGKWTESKKDIVVEVMEISPDTAKELLKRNLKNRRMNRKNVQKIKNDIMDGKWFFTGSGMSFYKDGVLADGQTRLTAISEGNKTVRAVVTFGLPDESAIALDCGKTRNESATAQIVSDDIPKSALRITGFYLQMERMRASCSQRQKIDFYNRLKAHVDFIINAYEEGSKAPRGLATAYVQAALLAAKADKVNPVSSDEIYHFIKILISGVTTKTEDQAIIKFRDYLMQNVMSGSGTARVDCYLRTQKALKNYLTGNIGGRNVTSKPFWKIDRALLPKMR